MRVGGCLRGFAPPKTYPVLPRHAFVLLSSIFSVARVARFATLIRETVCVCTSERTTVAVAMLLGGSLPMGFPLGASSHLVVSLCLLGALFATCLDVSVVSLHTTF